MSPIPFLQICLATRRRHNGWDKTSLRTHCFSLPLHLRHASSVRALRAGMVRRRARGLQGHRLAGGLVLETLVFLEEQLQLTRHLRHNLVALVPLGLEGRALAVQLVLQAQRGVRGRGGGALLVLLLPRQPEDLALHRARLARQLVHAHLEGGDPVVHAVPGGQVRLRDGGAGLREQGLLQLELEALLRILERLVACLQLQLALLVAAQAFLLAVDLVLRPEVLRPQGNHLVSAHSVIRGPFTLQLLELKTQSMRFHALPLQSVTHSYVSVVGCAGQPPIPKLVQLLHQDQLFTLPVAERLAYRLELLSNNCAFLFEKQCLRLGLLQLS
eukprot:Rhum_TRINITY_DN2148_c0_g1::Rhum_TRINITY_DN2148_c0_g1_i1::g.6098::m.6098